ncbi:MAG: glutathionylspermidine synthase family protein [Rhodospirillaceae bacterium]|nr:glutathionylspermidine synthase family protein [Rhodospirillaceae bacterium]
MKRISIAPRADWAAKVEALGFDWHTASGADGAGTDGAGAYWDESAYWQLTAAEVDILEAATDDLHAMCTAATGYAIERKLLPYFGFSPDMIAVVEDSWANRKTEPSVYGRFDLAYTGGEHAPKLLEYNADTPTGLYEASVVQWTWLEERFPDHDQFNSIHEGLVAAWGKVKQQLKNSSASDALHFTCVMPHAEDEGTLRYMLDTALEADLSGKILNAADIGWTTPEDAHPSSLDGEFVDADNQTISTLFKILPWDWLLADKFGPALAHAVMHRRLNVIEPAWKAVMANKAILAVLWEMYPNHPNLLPAFMDRRAFPKGSKVVAKPLLGREGANISIAELGDDGAVVGGPIESLGGAYGDEGYVYQALAPLAESTDAAGHTHRAIIGSWVIDHTSRGIGIREDTNLITHNRSRFVPHLFTE